MYSFSDKLRLVMRFIYSYNNVLTSYLTVTFQLRINTSLSMKFFIHCFHWLALRIYKTFLYAWSLIWSLITCHQNVMASFVDWVDCYVN